MRDIFPRRRLAQASGGKVKVREDVYGAVSPTRRRTYKRFINKAGEGGTLGERETESITPSAYSAWALSLVRGKRFGTHFLSI